MNSVSPADLDGVFEFERPLFQDRSQAIQLFYDDLGRAADEKRLGGVDHIVGSQSEMEPARRFRVAGRSHALGNRRGKGDDIVLDLEFNLLNALDFEARMLAEQARGFFGYLTGFGERLRGGQFYLQPLPIFVLFAPDAADLRAGVAGYHSYPVIQ